MNERKATEAQIIAYKTSLYKIHKKSIELGLKMSKTAIEREIKSNAGFVWESTKHPDVTTEDMINLTIHADLYSDQFGLSNGYPDNEQDGLIRLNIK